MLNLEHDIDQRTLRCRRCGVQALGARDYACRELPEALRDAAGDDPGPIADGLHWERRPDGTEVLRSAPPVESGRLPSAQSVAELINLTKLCFGNSKAAGWHDKPRDDGTFIALIHSEVSECLEGLRTDAMDDHLPHRKMAEVELADTLIRIFDFAGYKGYDLGSAVYEKLAYNMQRTDHKRDVRAGAGGKKF